jgi:hypothetical protein
MITVPVNPYFFSVGFHLNRFIRNDAANTPGVLVPLRSGFEWDWIVDAFNFRSALCVARLNEFSRNKHGLAISKAVLENLRSELTNERDESTRQYAEKSWQYAYALNPGSPDSDGIYFGGAPASGNYWQVLATQEEQTEAFVDPQFSPVNAPVWARSREELQVSIFCLQHSEDIQTCLSLIAFLVRRFFEAPALAFSVSFSTFLRQRPFFKLHGMGRPPNQLIGLASGLL